MQIDISEKEIAGGSNMMMDSKVKEPIKENNIVPEQDSKKGKLSFLFRCLG
jgi:hypothetical protein